MYLKYISNNLNVYIFSEIQITLDDQKIDNLLKKVLIGQLKEFSTKAVDKISTIFHGEVKSAVAKVQEEINRRKTTIAIPT